MGQKGTTLVEALVAMLILGIAAAAILPAFVTQMDASNISEERTTAVAASQQVLETHRLTDPSTMPTSGSSSPQMVVVGPHAFSVITRYCVTSAYCDTTSRHVVVEVWSDGVMVYDVETVYTKLE